MTSLALWPAHGCDSGPGSYPGPRYTRVPHAPWSRLDQDPGYDPCPGNCPGCGCTRDLASKLGWTYWRILDFSFGGRTENRYDLALEMVSGANFRCVLHHISSLTRLEGSWDQVWPESGPKPKIKYIFEFPPNRSPSQNSLPVWDYSRGECRGATLGRRCWGEPAGAGFKSWTSNGL